MTKSIYREPKARVLKAIAVFCLLFTSSTGARADELRYLGESAESLSVLMDEVDGARKTIDLTYFIFNPSSSVTKVLVNKLIAKARQGVRVRLLLDANPHSEKLQAEFTGAMLHKGIQIKFYHPGWQYNPLNNVRSHAKVAIFDGKSYISGGRNIEDDYYGTGDWMNYVDREVWVRGPSVRQAIAGFNRLWNDPKSVVRQGATREGLAMFEKDWGHWDKKTVMTEKALAERFRKSAELPQTPVVSCDNVEFTFDDPDFVNAMGDDSGTGNHSYMSGMRLIKKETTDAILKAMFAARKKMLLENYSYLPTQAVAAALDQARRRKIPVTIVTNRDVEKESYAQSIQKTAIDRDNHGTQRILQLSRHGSIRDSWDVVPPKTAFWTIHGKTFVIDDSTTIVSSFNIDPRSYHTNLETAVLAHDCPAFARIVTEKTNALVRNFETDKSCAKCQLPTRDNGILKSLIGWVMYDFISDETKPLPQTPNPLGAVAEDLEIK